MARAFVKLRGADAPIEQSFTDWARSVVGDETLVASPEAPDDIAILSVPLGPAGRKVPELIAVRAEIPGFGNQLDLGQQRILLNDIKKSTEPIDFHDARGAIWRACTIARSISSSADESRPI